MASVAGSLKRFHALANDVHRVETALDGGRFRITLETAGPARSDRLARLELASWAWRARWPKVWARRATRWKTCARTRSIGRCWISWW